MKYFKNTILIVLIFIIRSFATQETVITVIQPIFTENGITESISTYVYYANYTGDLMAELTFAENRVITEKGIENRNLANILGFEVKILYDENMPSDVQKILKLKISIPDQTNIKVKYKDEITIGDVISATIKCLQKNMVKYRNTESLNIIIDGNEKYSKYSKIYPINR